jgi:hypothetical protein
MKELKKKQKSAGHRKTKAAPFDFGSLFAIDLSGFHKRLESKYRLSEGIVDNNNLVKLD